MAGTIINNPVVQFFNDNGRPLSGGKITTFLSNTTTPASTWQNEALSTLNTNPIILNSRGEATIWLTPDIQYTFVVTDADDTLIQTVNDIYGSFSSSLSAAEISYTPAGTGAVETTVENQLNQIVTRSGYDNDTNFNNAAVGKVAIDGTNKVLAPRFEGNALDDAGTPDAIFRVNRTHSANTSPHSFRDQTVFSPVGSGLAMASFDSAITSSGAADHDHTIGFQSRPTHSGPGTITDLQGYGWYPIVDGPVVNTWGVEIRTPAGAGAITNEYGIRIRNLTRGTNKHPIFIDNNLGTNVIGAETNFNNSGVVSVGGNARLFLGDSANGFKSVAYNHNQNTNTYHIGDAIQSIYYGPQDITFRSAPVGVAGATPTFTNIVNIRTDQTNPSFAAVFPAVDNVSNLGLGGFRWKEIFAANGTINTSDARKKTEVISFKDAEIEAAKALSKEIGVFQFLDSVAKKGDEARKHIGMTVQRAIEIMQSHGLDPFNYSFICYDKWDDEFIEHPAIYEQVIVEEAEYETLPAWDEPVTETLVIDGKKAQISRTIHHPKQMKLIKDSVIGDGPVLQEAWKEQTRVAGDSYGFRMDQLLAFIARGIEARLSELEK